MNCKNVMDMTVLFLLLPTWIGYIWVEAVRIKEGWSRLVHAWVMGFTTMLAVGQLILVPLVALQKSLTLAMIFWEIAITILALVSFFLLLQRWNSGTLFPAYKKEHTSVDSRKAAVLAEVRRKRLWIAVFGVLAAVLIFLQAYIPARYEHGDDDDARFISEEVSAYVHDTMFQDDPIAGDMMYWNVGEVKKDLTSPWTMYVAICCKISDIPPAVMSHMYLPFFLILLCYAVYLLIGYKWMQGDWEKTLLFLIFLSVIHLWGYTSTHTLASMLLLRIWQGKAMCASFMLPLFFYLMYQIMQKEYEQKWIVFLYVASTAACLLSGIGIVTTPVILFLYGIIDFIYYRNHRKTLTIWLAAVPNIICLLYYLVR